MAHLCTLMVWISYNWESLQAYVIQQLWFGLQENQGSDYYTPETIPEVRELDELEIFVKSKKIKFGCGMAANHFK